MAYLLIPDLDRSEYVSLADEPASQYIVKKINTPGT